MSKDGLVAYARWAGHTPYAQLPFNEVDAALWSQLVYLPLENTLTEETVSLPLQEAMARLQRLEAESYEIFLRRRLELAREMAGLPRYSGVVLSRFVNQLSVQDQMQFCALTATLPDGSAAVCFRGTDTTLVGWKEDFNLSFEYPVPAQQAALRYAQQAAKDTEGALWLLGHSKGGNLAVYAGANLPLPQQQRVAQVYSFDGPGLMPEAVETPGYQRISGRIRSLLPQGTLVGVLLNRHKPAQVVKSRALGLFQHDLFSWQVEESAARFVALEELSRVSRTLEGNLGAWLSGLSREERQVFSDTIFKVLTAADDKTLVDLARPRRNRLSKMLEAARGIPPEVRSALIQALGDLVSTTFSAFAREAVQALAELITTPAEPPQQDHLPPPSNHSQH